ncbi:MAG TPA: mannose-1-phosphate guanylyltransferase [Anaerolineales bacterium]|nr:mannose-1-phosphate guanylyltransferase [Anaerolineales bacterium]
MPNPLYALIMAGGTGSRLWPRSRTQHPKQFLDITGDLTMLQQSQQRLLPLIPIERTLVATNRQYVEIVTRQLPDMPPDNILGEPTGRGTAAAIGLAAVHLRKRNPDALMAVLTADHLIKKTDTFRQVLQAAADVAAEDWLVTLGITPNYPETGYGYIERGEFLGMVGDFEGYRVERFVEKPDLARAEAYVSSGNYAWNSGMFIWKVRRILEEMERHMPDLYEGLLKIEASIHTDHAEETLLTLFPTLPNQTIDYGIMEKASQVAVLPVDIGWHDVGSWSAVYDVLPRDKANNVVVGRHVTPDSVNSLIYSPKRLVATLGLDDIVIVDTDDVLLVCPRSRAQDVKKIVDILKVNGEAGYLDGVVNVQPLSKEQISRAFEVADNQEKVLISLMLHAGLWPSHIAMLTSQHFDFIKGWVATPEGKRPLPEITRRYLFAWFQETNRFVFSFAEIWKDSASVKDALTGLGRRIGATINVDVLFETLARALFATSEEGQVIQKVLGEEAELVRVPLHALFPFSTPDFSGAENEPLGERAHIVLNRAAERLK